MSKLPQSLDTLLTRLHGRLGARVSSDAEALAAVATDESGLPAGQPGGVVWPLHPDEVVFVAREAAAQGVALVPRGGGTGKAGACIPGAGELVVDFSRMNRVLELRPQDLYAVVEPGLITLELDRAAHEKGLMYPPDPASLESCTLGGNVSTNAGGPRAVKYGTTSRYVWGVTIVLPGGEVHRMGKRSIKGVAGYDLTSLVVGSEGTLAFVVEAVLHLVPMPPAVETAWLSFPDVLTASRAAEAIFAAGVTPRMLEVLDRHALDAVRPKSAFAVPEAGAGLLVETDGPDEVAFGELSRICELALEHGATDSAVAASERDREGMRRARRLVSSSLKESFPFKISDDVAVPRSRMAELLEGATREAHAAGVTVAAYGHLGDGNLHVNLLCRTAEERVKARQARRRTLSVAVALGGTITGEHGIGLTKRDALGLEQTAELIALQRRVKRVFDPANLMNPGKALPPEGEAP
jgi:glycolate oxidase